MHTFICVSIGADGLKWELSASSCLSMNVETSTFYSSLQDLATHTPPAFPQPCSPAAAATCPSSAPRCTRRTSCSHHPAGLAWLWAAPGQASRHRCRWRSLGWLQEMVGIMEKECVRDQFPFISLFTSVDSSLESMSQHNLSVCFSQRRIRFNIWLRVRDGSSSLILMLWSAVIQKWHF